MASFNGCNPFWATLEKRRWHVQMLGQFLLARAQLVVQHVAFADGQNVLLVHQVGIVLLQFAAQRGMLGGNVVGIGGYQKERHGIPFDVPKEPQAQALSSDAPSMIPGMSAITKLFSSVGHHRVGRRVAKE